MSEHEKHTEFLRQCVLYDESARRRKLVENISQLQRDMRCVRRAVWLMAILTAAIMAGLGYGIILGDNFPYNLPQFITNLICALGMGSLISLVAFAGLGMVFRMRLDQQREKCRQLVSRLLESRLGKPVTTPMREMLDNRVGGRQGRPGCVANELNDYSV